MKYIPPVSGSPVLRAKKHNRNHFTASIQGLRIFLAWVIPLMCANAAVFDFSAPLQAVNVSLSGYTVSYEVYDPQLGLWKRGEHNNSNPVSNLTNVGGVVSWLEGTTSVHTRVYDPLVSLWRNHQDNNSSAVSNLTNVGGVVAYREGTTTVHGLVYDPQVGLWKPRSDANSATVSNLTNIGCVIAYLEGTTTVHSMVYDPLASSWKPRSDANSATVSNLTNIGSVIAYLEGTTTVHSLVYDPLASSWKPRSEANSSAVSNLTNVGGVVAYREGTTTVHGLIYDHQLGLWKQRQDTNGNTVSNLAVSTTGTVTWTAVSNFTKGYNAATGSWYNGPTLPLAYFALSRSSGNAPLFVWFIDMSIGGTGWTWNFGDGGLKSQRAGSYVFNSFGRFTVTQVVTGTSGSSSATATVTTDISAPSGSVLVNNNDAVAYSTSVSLALAATDNSGSVASMQFSNDGSTWSGWEPFTSSKAWTLSAGDGLKTVYAQFKDAVDNISATVSDTITLDTSPPPVASFSAASYSASEGGASAHVTVNLSAPSTKTVTIQYASSDGTATAGSDYTAVSGTLTFAAGVTNQNFDVPVSNDSVVELNETVQLSLSNPTNATVGPPATLTIMDDDSPVVSFASGTFNVNENQATGALTVSLSAASGRVLTVNFTTSNGSATAGSDYTATNETLTFASGDTSKTILIPIINDSLDELTETILVTLGGPANTTLGAPDVATLSILDDDPPSVGFSNATYSVSENAGSATISVQLTKVYAQTVFVDYATSNGSALAVSDYAATNGTVVFAPGQTSKTFPVTLFNDTSVEANETINLGLSSVVNGTAGTITSAVLTVIDDDTPPATGSLGFQLNGQFGITFTGPIGQRFAIEASPDLLNWTTVSTNTNDTGSVPFTDPASPGLGQRFYRAVILP